LESELAAFRGWFAEFDAAAWDRRTEDNIAAGRLDALANEALGDLRAGRSRRGEASRESLFLELNWN
jgi:hypothetical protein